jgi:hypothetical protein
LREFVELLNSRGVEIPRWPAQSSASQDTRARIDKASALFFCCCHTSSVCGSSMVALGISVDVWLFLRESDVVRRVAGHARRPNRRGKQEIRLAD